MTVAKTIKFLYSYGGRIVPRPDGKLRYAGGHTRVLSVDRSITFAELMVKLGESCGSSVNLTCKLPGEDLDVLVTVKSDEELRSVVEEYERSSLPEAKIRAVLFPARSGKKITPPSSPISCFDFPSAAKARDAAPPSVAAVYRAYAPPAAVRRCASPVVGYPVVAGKSRYCQARAYHVPIRNHTQ
ncbi:octicosapeptide/Phox/Bem1p family protein [Striga asiatica]|uniref:Octicosapeptide/Phox/Bem1p family protein n=1 Tax=Striga asiatica TaxID=4170 RepID=A0A5A7RHZ2_STRAF|nr:octicosapeptide/Phox/Bem1p family protein [Striga asiatica]